MQQSHRVLIGLSFSSLEDKYLFGGDIPVGLLYRIRRRVKIIVRYLRLGTRDVLRLLRSGRTLRDADLIAVGFPGSVKCWVEPFFPGKSIFFIADDGFLPRPLRRVVLRHSGHAKLLNYGYKGDPGFRDEFAQKGRLLVFEDGFIRGTGDRASVGRGLPPFSACLDSRGLHFDGSVVTDLDQILNDLDCADPEVDSLVDYATECLSDFRDIGLSKYWNPWDRPKVDLNTRSALSECVVILGQVPGDQSLRFGRSNDMSLSDLARVAVIENPGRRVFLRSHPMQPHTRLLHREILSYGVESLDPSVPLWKYVSSGTRVYTFTSQSGFESLVFGAEVVVFGTPFYAGWGLTDDREAFTHGKRMRSLSLPELFAGAFLMYPQYLSMKDKSLTTPRAAIDQMRLIQRQRNQHLKAIMEHEDNP